MYLLRLDLSEAYVTKILGAKMHRTFFDDDVGRYLLFGGRRSLAIDK